MKKGKEEGNEEETQNVKMNIMRFAQYFTRYGYEMVPF